MGIPQLIKRDLPKKNQKALEDAGFHPLLARLWAARGILNPNEICSDLNLLIPPNKLAYSNQAAKVLCDAIEAKKNILVFADYDCDGATACALAYRALSSMGAKVSYFVPNRFETGYGLSSNAIEKLSRIQQEKPEIILTVDNGISSFDAVSTANSLGIKVIITDHHLPITDDLPTALAIVNPNQKSCAFPSKNLSGVGVIFYLMLSLRSEMRFRGYYPPFGGPNLSKLLDLVALGTIADLVKLDQNNRLLVNKGLKNIRNGQLQLGLKALFSIAGRDPNNAATSDLSFFLAPRINAAGRLKDMHLGVRCLATDNYHEAIKIAKELDSINAQRRQLEAEMHNEALKAAQDINTDFKSSICIYNPTWHQGIVGLVASRLKEKFWKPVLAFAPAHGNEMRGSGRSIPGIHLKKILDSIFKSHNGLIDKFGGHAMAIGLTIQKHNYKDFVKIFEAAVRESSKSVIFNQIIETDGSLETKYINFEIAKLLKNQVWGMGFSEPLFHDFFSIRSQILVNKRHLKLQLEKDKKSFYAIWFGREVQFPNERIEVVYSLEKNIWRNQSSIFLKIEYAK